MKREKYRVWKKHRNYIEVRTINDPFERKGHRPYIYLSLIGLVYTFKPKQIGSYQHSLGMNALTAERMFQENRSLHDVRKRLRSKLYDDYGIKSEDLRRACSLWD